MGRAVEAAPLGQGRRAAHRVMGQASVPAPIGIENLTRANDHLLCGTPPCGKVVAMLSDDKILSPWKSVVNQIYTFLTDVCRCLTQKLCSINILLRFFVIFISQTLRRVKNFSRRACPFSFNRPLPHCPRTYSMRQRRRCSCGRRIPAPPDCLCPVGTALDGPSVHFCGGVLKFFKKPRDRRRELLVCRGRET